ncbi:unnamed protein product [Adineta ricciae]|uniref:G patch domain-containing protein 11 n=1 Tax=Adineta ricciae TaxID=249248 RepID=A0A813YRI7_ADIRI|nr:unnamed protein product [Adineta ricciae]CAF1256822.1 unnamed protein product [Adineta ricciae]
MLKRLHEDEDDEDDYMSDKILTAAAQASAPQLLNPRRRVPPPTSAPLPKEKSRKLIETEQREQGLSTAIASDNKGFQLLKKMGYKEGTKLGMNQSNGLAEPIPIKILPSRTGLGEQNEKEEQLRIKAEIRTKFHQQAQSTYQDHLKQKYHFKRLRKDIGKCQSICEKLDREKFNLEENILWRNSNIQQDEKGEEDEDFDDGNNQQVVMELQLKTLTEYLRDKHLYCIWCGQTFETSEELDDTCPGNERDLH